MIHTLKLGRRAARFRAPLFASLLAFAFGGCDVVDPTDPLASDAGVSDAELAPAAPAFAAGRFAGGIPIGAFGQPTSAFGAEFNGAMRNIYPNELMNELATIKARGGKVVLNLGGGESRFQDSRGHFSMSKWKTSVNRYKGVNLNSYINDGTVIGHYLLDEPHNANRWHGKTISQSTIDEMAKYSKQLWPKLPTVVRAYPDWLAKYNGKYRYLDAAWLQYVHRFGDVENFTRKQISAAQKKGLGLIVGLNVLKGGPNRRKMTASQVRSYGSALLASNYPCAFISWKHDSRYLASKDIKAAMKYLRSKAQNRGSRSCRGGGKASAPPASAPSKASGSGNKSSGGSSASGSSSIKVKLTGRVEKRRHHLTLTWSGIKGSTVEIHRNYRTRIKRDPNDGRFQNWVPFRGRTTYQMKVCQKGTSKCSKTVKVTLR